MAYNASLKPLCGTIAGTVLSRLVIRVIRRRHIGVLLL